MCMVFMPTDKVVVLARYVILYRTGMPRHHIFPELLNTTVSFPYNMFIEGERAYPMKLIPDTHPIRYLRFFLLIGDSKFRLDSQ